MSLVYQTINLNCDVEYWAEPLDFTGIRTIKLTNKPANVEVWISSENTGGNLYPLRNRGDGWVNLDEPLQNCYIYTKGVNNTGEQLILNVTGQKDIFEYGTSSVEQIGNVEKLDILERVGRNIPLQLEKIPISSPLDTFLSCTFDNETVFFDRLQYIWKAKTLTEQKYYSITNFKTKTGLGINTYMGKKIFLDIHYYYSGLLTTLSNTSYPMTEESILKTFLSIKVSDFYILNEQQKTNFVKGQKVDGVDAYYYYGILPTKKGHIRLIKNVEDFYSTSLDVLSDFQVINGTADLMYDNHLMFFMTGGIIE